MSKNQKIGFIVLMLVGFGLLNISFVNCSRKYGVNSEELSLGFGQMSTKSPDSESNNPSGSEESTTSEDDGEIDCPPGSTAPECVLKDDTSKLPDSQDPDKDADQLRSKFCGVYEKPDIPDAKDLFIGEQDKDDKKMNSAGKGSNKAITAVGNLTIEKFRGKLIVEHANRLENSNDTRGMLFVRSRLMDNLNNHRGALALSSSDVGQISDYRGGACVAGRKIQSISNGRGILLVIGPKDGMGELQDLTDHRGKVVLINVTVKSLSKFRGVIFTLNSKIEGPIDPDVHIIEIHPKK